MRPDSTVAVQSKMEESSGPLFELAETRFPILPREEAAALWIYFAYAIDSHLKAIVSNELIR